MKTISVTSEKAIEELNRLQREFTSSGLWPILIGDDEEILQIEEGLEDSYQSISEIVASEILADSTAINVEKWFAERTSQDPELYQCEDGDWPDDDEPGEIGIVTHLNENRVSIVLLPIHNSFDAFAYLEWGGWNDCPLPQEHCAIHRYWKAKYGSEVVSITRDIVQCVVSNPPRDRDAAMVLAREQYRYCYDIVDQGTGTISALAASLMNAGTWYFWWD